MQRAAAILQGIPFKKCRTKTWIGSRTPEPGSELSPLFGVAFDRFEPSGTFRTVIEIVAPKPDGQTATFFVQEGKVPLAQAGKKLVVEPHPDGKIPIPIDELPKILALFPSDIRKEWAELTRGSRFGSAFHQLAQALA